MPVDHYENFPVASLLLPARLRPPVEAIYAFARSADDIADEGNADADARLVALDAYRHALDRIAADEPIADPELAPVFEPLARAIRAYDLSLAPLHDLLAAFRQDVVQARYADFAELMDYCRRSANPVGRLLLHLYNVGKADDLRRSDAICSALQLINFWQDVAIDHAKGRIYLPQDDLAAYGVSEEQIAAQRADAAWRALMLFQVQRARAMMLDGAPLAHRLPGRIGWELRLIVHGGLRILERIEAVDYDVFRARPTLGKSDWLRMMWRACTNYGRYAR